MLEKAWKNNNNNDITYDPDDDNNDEEHDDFNEYEEENGNVSSIYSLVFGMEYVHEPFICKIKNTNKSEIICDDIIPPMISILCESDDMILYTMLTMKVLMSMENFFLQITLKDIEIITKL